ncbi:hypothetical protein TNCV_908711 [Trichonephila clavipes]|nr:hypothetical protein TNCV_908711 [Trichonephila clavipes]
MQINHSFQIARCLNWVSEAPEKVDINCHNEILTLSFLPRLRYLNFDDSKLNKKFKSDDSTQAKQHDNPPTWYGVKPAILGIKCQRQTNYPSNRH